MATDLETIRPVSKRMPVLIPWHLNPDRYGCSDTDDDGISDPDEGGSSARCGCLWDDNTQWSDYDGTVWRQRVREESGCVSRRAGSSLFDRFGCLDSDDDGRSNPDSNWTTDDGADDCPDDPRDACVAYILKNPTALITKRWIGHPCVDFPCECHHQTEAQVGLANSREHPDLTVVEEVSN